MRWIKQNILFILVIVIASSLRLWQLGNIPYGVANDEASYIYSGYTIWKTGGFDIVGKFLPLSINLDSSLSPVPVYLISVFTGIFGLSATFGRLPFAILGIGTVVVIFFIANEIFKNYWISFFSALSLAISPWHLLVSRGAWDGGIALFFYSLGILIFLKNFKKGNINWSLPALLFGFYSYHATKVYFIALIPVLLFFYLNYKKKFSKELWVFLIGIFFILLSFIFILKYQNITRQQVLLWNDSNAKQAIVKKVNFEREKSTAPFLLREIFSNKMVYFTGEIIKNYLGAFSPEMLYVRGDINSITSYGNFISSMALLIELPFIFLSLIILFSKSKINLGIFIIALLLIAPLPATVGYKSTYVIRGIMLLLPFSLLAGFGIFNALFFLKKQKKIISIILISLFIFLYIFNFVSTLYSYYFQFATIGGESWNQSSRKMSEFIKNNYKKYSKIYIVTGDEHILLQYAIENKINPYLFNQIWRNNKNEKTIGKTTFLNVCFKNKLKNPFKFLPPHTLYIINVSIENCYPRIKPTFKISDPMEPLRIIYNIYEKN